MAARRGRSSWSLDVKVAANGRRYEHWTIASGAHPMRDAEVTVINVFTVEPLDQRELVALLTRATDGFVRHAAGFISARLHRSLDGTKVAMYSQWRNIEAYEAMRKDPSPMPYLQQALAIAKFEPGIYEVVEAFLPSIGDV